MSSAQPISTQTVSSSNAATNVTKKSAENPQDRFLKLLVTQMKNQDPLKPLDNAEVTSQLAQISTVSGIDKLNSTLQLLNSDVAESLSMEAAQMIGHSVLVPGTTLTLEQGAAAAGVELDQAVDQLKVTIMDSSGLPIRHMDLGNMPAGVNAIPWDGKTDSGILAANGEYTFSIVASQGGNDIKANALSLGTVNSVTPNEKGALLDIDKIGLVSLSDIKQVF
ncbi:flagellar basal-body rod modification protein FlgD [Nitrosomonas sp. PY1]|uniref:flagellar hook assembly protein FlgD n=1 Tax=Nitrosomonas sp. PY1 TaxID=1803906 RepID=UPI001FC86251|nr:flagellar hook assembly protein FlgD [Nitrosomonas sp. PY1]GKS68508.1 flagellar basal-body rod modification protein FlgD [Nitrosomonas sp. PY1]